MGQSLSCWKAQGDSLASTFPPEDALKPLLAQNYERIREQCLQSGKLFEDPLFPASSKSLVYHLTPRLPKQWMRPKKIASFSGQEPRFFVEGGSAADLIQGELGNCWVVAAASALADHSTLLDRVVPSDQSFESGHYAGIFRFNFYVYGQWIEVVVDDRLPTDDGSMIYVHSAQPNEFWGALLEKAYAKLFGCYEALSGGVCAEALTAFTGGVVEYYPLKAKTPRNIGRLLTNAIEEGSLLCTGIWGSQNLELENGLVTGHAFTIVDVKRVELLTDGRMVTLLKVRNPWANNIEWRGNWSDRSRAWTMISDSARLQLRHQIRDDGEFWMDLNDFVVNFDQLDICNMTRDSAPNRWLRRWDTSAVHGVWIKGQTAGGRLKHYESFASNPQYEFSIGDTDSGERVERQERFPISTVVELTQKRRRSRVAYNPLHIGFVLYQLRGDQTPPMPSMFFLEQPRIGAVDSYVNLAVASKRFSLFPGRYLVVATSWEPDEEASFMLRVWSQASVKAAGDSSPVSTAYNYPSWNQHSTKDNPKKKPVDVAKHSRNSNNNNKDTITNDPTEPLLDRKRPDLQKPEMDNGPPPKITTQLSETQSRLAFKLFKSYAGKDFMLNAEQLQRGLNSSYAKSRFYRFTLDCCRSLIALADADNRFKLFNDQFSWLYNYLDVWTDEFLRRDKRRRYYLESGELRDALYSLKLLPLRTTGDLPRKIDPDNPEKQNWMPSLMRRFADRNERISYSDFIQCCSKLVLADKLLTKYASADGTCTVSADELLTMLLKF